MNLTIHRGTNEIGGSCVELKTDTTRLLIDLGQPIVNKSGSNFNADQMKDKSIDELIALGILPDVAGLYNDESGIDAVLLSHAHIDHFGLMNYINKDIPVYLGEATNKIIELSRVFTQSGTVINKPVCFTKEVAFTIGDITVTPYWMDHSAFDAYAFLIEAAGKRIFYSGDFRAHGRKEKVYRWFLHNAPRDIDYLILEGTGIGKKNFKSELEVEAEMTEAFRNSDNGCYVWTSTQNIDRLVSIYKACAAVNKTLVVDPYAANVLDILSKFALLPNPKNGFANIKVMFISSMTTKLIENKHENMVYPLKNFKIKWEEIAKSPEKYVMLIRSSLKSEIKNIGWRDGKLIYSMWEGYKNQPSSKKFLDDMTAKGFQIIDIHASGHADEATLVEFANALNPKNIIPIHTFEKTRYSSVFSQPIRILDDNEMLEL